MRPKELRLIITFHSTVQAMKLETIAKNAQIQGRLIPVPREITAGCGLAFSATPTEKEKLESVIAEHNVTIDQMLNLVI